MITFIIGILILFFGYVFYSGYVEKQFEIKDIPTPAQKLNDKIDFIPLTDRKNMLIHLLNIAGLGPILGAIQGILFGPVAFILIPLGCVLMGSVHDYFAGMISVRNNGAQITEIIKNYLGNNFYRFFIVIVSLMLLIVASVFVFTAGDVIAQRFFNQNDFSLSNPVILTIYLSIALYYIIATLFPIDKIIGNLYPIFGILLLTGTGLVLLGFFNHDINLQNLDIANINQHPSKLHILPMFFMTVSCGLLSGFHSTQATIISRTIKSEKAGRKVFFGMMCVESLIAMIWAAGAMHVYSLNLVPQNIIGTANVINSISDALIIPALTFIVTIAVVVLPITTGDTALRGLRMILSEALSIPQKALKNRLLIIVPIAFLLLGIIVWAKLNGNSFSVIWRYFNFINQLMAIPLFLCATIFLFRQKKNYFITLLPGVFYIYIVCSFIFNTSIGFNLNYQISQILSIIITMFCIILFFKNKINKLS